MRSALLLLIFSCLGFRFFAQKDSLSYFYSIDLTKTDGDKIEVKLIPPVMHEKTVSFHFPAIIPGTYAIYNFGRFISDFKVIAKNGSTLPFLKPDMNSFLIHDADSIAYITYKVEDTWDTNQKKDFVFEPAGTNIQANKNFILNNHGFFGYFKNHLNVPIQLNVKKNEGFYASTGLANLKSGESTDIIKAKDYYELVDSPIMYCIPDTTTLRIGSTDVLVSVYSPTKRVSSKFIAAQIDTILNAQKMYLGGTLPVSKYAFVIYLTDSITASGSTGALEHSYSSLYTLMATEPQYLAQMMKDVAAHEFFHIVTPLNIHSEEIGFFDFNQPKMSQHLWLYEGLTEYAAHHVQVKYGLSEIDQFISVFQNKMEEAQKYFNDSLSFTLMSKNVLDSSYHEQYSNVYAKGALIGLCMDILLRYYSNGKYGTQELMHDLAVKFGKSKSFKDNELFDIIEKLTYPQIRTFLNECVAGNKPLPFVEVFDKVGFTYKPILQKTIFTIGGIGLGINPANEKIIIYDVTEMNDFGQAMNYQEGDEIIEFNGIKLNIDNVQDILGNYTKTVKDGDKLIVLVNRKNKKGKEKLVKLKAKQRKVVIDIYNSIELNKNAGAKQIIARNAWLGISGD